MLGRDKYNKMVIVSKIIQVILPLGKVGKNKSFPEGPKAFTLLVTRHEGKHYPNAVLELPFLLVVSWCWWPGPSLRHKLVTGKCSYRSLEKRTGDVDQSHWRLQASLGNAAGKSGPQHMTFFFLSSSKITKVKKVSLQIIFLRGRKWS